jgi:hypothetical protein
MKWSDDWVVKLERLNCRDLISRSVNYAKLKLIMKKNVFHSLIISSLTYECIFSSNSRNQYSKSLNKDFLCFFNRFSSSFHKVSWIFSSSLMQILKQVSKLYHKRSNLIQILSRERKRSFEQMKSRIRFEMHLALNTYNIVLSSMFSQICEWLDLVHSWSYSNLRLDCFLSSSFMSFQSSKNQEIRVRSKTQFARNDRHSSTSLKLFITTSTSTSIAVEIRYWCTELNVSTTHLISWE